MGKALLAVFDMDGTLVDSAPQIVWAANEALGGAGRVDARDLGPPLGRMLGKACGLPEEHPDVAAAAERFAALYDPAAGLSKPWPGVEEALEALAKAGLPMALATNKRSAPAASVVRARRWEGIFRAGAYCVEDFRRLGGGKSSALADCASRLGVDPARCAMVGDTMGDFEAGLRAGFGTFRHCLWGGHPAPLPEAGLAVVVDSTPAAWLSMVQAAWAEPGVVE